MTRILVVLAIVGAAGCSSGEAEPTPKPKRHWKTDGYRDTTPQERTAARAALAATRLPLPDSWLEGPSHDGKRDFARDAITIKLYLANAEELVAVADEPPTSLADLVARAHPAAVSDGWPWGLYRLGNVTDRGENGDTFWIAGPMEESNDCADPGCRDTWQANGERGFVVMRTLGDHRFRCAAHGLDGPVLAEALAACKALTIQ